MSAVLKVGSPSTVVPSSVLSGEFVVMPTVFRFIVILNVILAASNLLTSPAFASNGNDGYAKDITFGNDGTVWFIYTGSRSGTLPACAEPNGLWLLNAATPAGQAMLAGILTASGRHQVINIQGSGTCLNSHETMNYFVVAGQ
jgi:hypothetical protein